MAQLNIQELSIRKTAVLVNVPENIVELVINFKNKSIHEALKGNKTVEDSGLGKFSIRKGVVLKKLRTVENVITVTKEKLAQEGISEKESIKLNKILVDYLEEKRYLETKI